MHNIKKWIPDAITILEEVGLVDEKKLTIESAYQGYFASFGAAIVQSGLFPAVVFFESKGNADADRFKVPEAILKLMQKQYPNDKFLQKYKNLSAFLLNIDNDENKQSKRIQTAIICLKLASRTFDNIETKNKKNASTNS